MEGKILEYINKSKTIYISTHIRPDGDAIGSAFAMYLAIKKMGKNVYVIMPSYSKKYNFLEELKYAVNSVKEDKYDLLIVLDSSDKKRLSITDEDFIKAREVIVFDHHKASSIDSYISYIDDMSPATCELIYNFMKKSSIDIDSKMASYLYLGIMEDTGSFNYERTTSKTYRIAADLIDKGAEFVKICKKINDTKTEAKTKLISYVIDNMETYFDDKLRISVVKSDDFRKLGIDDEEAEGMTNYLRMIDGTEVAVYIYQIGDSEYKVSLRSNGEVDCSKLAIKFNGGGHVRAAGFNMVNLKQEKNELIKLVGDVLGK